MKSWRIELTVWRLDRRLRGVVPWDARRVIRRDIRANLHDASQHVGEVEAIARLGDIDTVASEYRAMARRHRGGFRPDRGVRAALVVTAVLLAVTFVRIPTFNMVNTFDRHTTATTWEWETWRLWRFGGDVATDTLFEGTVYSYAYLIFALAAFILWSRAWRLLLPRRTHAFRSRAGA